MCFFLRIIASGIWCCLHPWAKNGQRTCFEFCAHARICLCVFVHAYIPTFRILHHVHVLVQFFKMEETGRRHLHFLCTKKGRDEKCIFHLQRKDETRILQFSIYKERTRREFCNFLFTKKGRREELHFLFTMECRSKVLIIFQTLTISYLIKEDFLIVPVGFLLD